jgi:hypothetical protein
MPEKGGHRAALRSLDSACRSRLRSRARSFAAWKIVPSIRQLYFLTLLAKANLRGLAPLGCSVYDRDTGRSSDC